MLKRIQSDKFPCEDKTRNEVEYIRKVISESGNFSIYSLVNLVVEREIVVSAEVTKIKQVSECQKRHRYDFEQAECIYFI